MIDYITKYQNNFVSSYMFKTNLDDLQDKGVLLYPLFNSNLFNMRIDYDEWPSSSTNNDRVIKPYNGSVFHIRNSYTEIFEDIVREEEKEIPDADEKVYKIRYSINLLPYQGEYVNEFGEVVNSEENFMSTLSGSEELEVFDTLTIK